MANPGNHKRFTIEFEGGRAAGAIRVPIENDASAIIRELELETPRPAIFISGGAGNMTQDELDKTRQIIDEGIARFAQEHNITVVDGGTESGVMAMIGEARARRNYTFPLIGVTPDGRVTYPGHENPDSDAVLDDGHSHFVLVESERWGSESQTIVNLTRAIAGNSEHPMIGILINGGKIAEQDVYIATATGERRIPVLVLEGSGRAANEIAAAYRTGKTNRAIIRAIVAGGDIHLCALEHGPDALHERLQTHFNRQKQ